MGTGPLCTVTKVLDHGILTRTALETLHRRTWPLDEKLEAILRWVDRILNRASLELPGARDGLARTVKLISRSRTPVSIGALMMGRSCHCPGRCLEAAGSCPQKGQMEMWKLRERDVLYKFFEGEFLRRVISHVRRRR